MTPHPSSANPAGINRPYSSTPPPSPSHLLPPRFGSGVIPLSQQTPPPRARPPCPLPPPPAPRPPPGPPPPPPALRPRLRAGHGREPQGDRRHRQQSREARLREHHRGAGAFRRTAQSRRHRLLQPLGQQHQPRDAAAAALALAEARRAQRRHPAQ